MAVRDGDLGGSQSWAQEGSEWPVPSSAALPCRESRRQPTAQGRRGKNHTAAKVTGWDRGQRRGMGALADNGTTRVNNAPRHLRPALSSSSRWPQGTTAISTVASEVTATWNAGERNAGVGGGAGRALLRRRRTRVSAPGSRLPGDAAGSEYAVDVTRRSPNERRPKGSAVPPPPAPSRPRARRRQSSRLQECLGNRGRPLVPASHGTGRSRRTRPGELLVPIPPPDVLKMEAGGVAA